MVQYTHVQYVPLNLQLVQKIKQIYNANLTMFLLLLLILMPLLYNMFEYEHYISKGALEIKPSTPQGKKLLSLTQYWP